MRCCDANFGPGGSGNVPSRQWAKKFGKHGRQRPRQCDPGRNLGPELIPVEELEVLVIAGGSNPHLESLERAVREFGSRFRLTKDAVDMAPLLAWADVMVAAAGSICWEICAMAVPAVLVVTAPNQTLAAGRLAELGAALSLGAG